MAGSDPQDSLAGHGTDDVDRNVPISVGRRGGRRAVWDGGPVAGLNRRLEVNPGHRSSWRRQTGSSIYRLHHLIVDVSAPAVGVAFLGVVVRHLGPKAIEPSWVLVRLKSDDETGVRRRPLQSDVLNRDLRPEGARAAQRGCRNISKPKRKIRVVSVILTAGHYGHSFAPFMGISLAYLEPTRSMVDVAEVPIDFGRPVRPAGQYRRLARDTRRHLAPERPRGCARAFPSMGGDDRRHASQSLDGPPGRLSRCRRFTDRRTRSAGSIRPVPDRQLQQRQRSA